MSSTQEESKQLLKFALVNGCWSMHLTDKVKTPS